jgi:5-methyltetrahydropteroyltriglutamate--homocysteine methyltransferase
LLFNSFALRLDLESNEETLTLEIKQWLAFAKQKIEEVVVLRNLLQMKLTRMIKQFEDNTLANTKKKATIIHNEEVKNRVIRIVEKILADKTLFDSKKSKLMY